jgi:hypothetical protein
MPNRDEQEKNMHYRAKKETNGKKMQSPKVEPATTNLKTCSYWPLGALLGSCPRVSTTTFNKAKR